MSKPSMKPMIPPGSTFGRLTVVSYSHSHKQRRVYCCQCLCGNVVLIFSINLKSGDTRSCGCYKNEIIRKTKNKKHGLHNTPTYSSWRSMLKRCNDPKCNSFEHYGGRGISVCDEWKTFSNFLRDLGVRPEGKTLDRIDVNGNYAPGNCKWSSPKEQAQNKRK